ncbi:hypothetical protein ACI09I_000891 [Cronobacter dublinensis]
MNNDELIAAGHELAKCLDNEPLIDIAKMIVRLSDKLDVTTLALREKTKQCEQLAAENAKLADCANFYRLGFKPVRGSFGIEYRPTEQLLDDCGNTALDAIKTPATDAFLREAHAQGVDAIRNALITLVEDEVGPNEYVPGFIRAAEMCVSLTTELRQGGAA